MVVIVIPREESERRNDIKREITRTAWKMAMRYGVPMEMLLDSKCIEESAENIASVINSLRKHLETAGTWTNTTEIDGEYFKPIRKVKSNYKWILEQENQFKKLDKIIKDEEIKKKDEEIRKEAEKLRTHRKLSKK